MTDPGVYNGGTYDFWLCPLQAPFPVRQACDSTRWPSVGETRCPRANQEGQNAVEDTSPQNGRREHHNRSVEDQEGPPGRPLWRTKRQMSHGSQEPRPTPREGAPLRFRKIVNGPDIALKQ